MFSKITKEKSNNFSNPETLKNLLLDYQPARKWDQKRSQFDFLQYIYSDKNVFEDNIAEKQWLAGQKLDKVYLRRPEGFARLIWTVNTQVTKN